MKLPESLKAGAVPWFTSQMKGVAETHKSTRLESVSDLGGDSRPE
jgi:hypothetical protein